MSRAEGVVVVGGGLAGLACAVRLHEAGRGVTVLESSGKVGGRVCSTAKRGFTIDRGFQVFLDAYPEAGELLDLEALDLQSFRPGALIYRGGRLHRLMDVFRCPQFALSTALQPIGNLRDKLLVGKMRLQALRPSRTSPENHSDTSTESFLRSYGFSESMIDGFVRAFYGGIFLERELRTSSKMFEFTFRMFASGRAAIPARGMQEIPRQLAARLPSSAIRTDTNVACIEPGRIILADDTYLDADQVVVATDAESANQLIPGLEEPPPPWRSVTGLYYTASFSPLGEAIIALNGEAHGLVNNVCVLSDVASDYSPDDRALISVSVLGLHEGGQIEGAVLNELRSWFGAQVDAWEHLHTDQIRRALPEQTPDPASESKKAFRSHGNVLICGDHCNSASIEGALVSGLRTADSLIESHGKSKEGPR